MPKKETDPFVGRFTLRRVWGPSSEELRAYHRLAIKIHKMLPEANITGIVDAIVFGIRCDDKNEDQMLESALALLDEEPLGYMAAHHPPSSIALH
jgi:hypothetical protein